LPTTQIENLRQLFFIFISKLLVTFNPLQLSVGFAEFTDLMQRQIATKFRVPPGSVIIPLCFN